MSTLRVVKKTTILFLCLGFSYSLSALPKYERTVLPFPRTLLESEKEMAKEVLKLQVYQDSVNPNQYYYVPPMHLRQYTQGAAAMMLNAVQIRHYADAKKALQMRDNYAKEHSEKRLAALAKDVENYKKDVENYKEEMDKAEQKLLTAMESNNAQLIEFLQKRFATKLDLYEKSLEKFNQAELALDNCKNDPISIPTEMRKAYERQAIRHLFVAGFDISPAVAEDPIESEAKINEALRAVEDYYGGFISVNAYGGFTEAQLTALRAFKAKYNPNIRVSLLPIDSLSFFALTELQADPKNDTGHKMFNQMKGSGDFLGANITMDASLSGGLGLAEHLAPFILPIGIKVTFKQQIIPTKAELSCNFENAFSVEGRSDTRDGFVIFDNDITVNLSSTDKNTTACHLDVKSGDIDAAQIKALQMLEEQLTLMGIHRTNLTKMEKENYYKSVLNDVHSNRRNDNSNIAAGIVAFFSSGWGGALVAAVSELTDFHWHTNIQNVHNFSGMKFDRKISIAGHTTIEKALPTNLCLVYNKNVNAYDRCTESELSEALNMQQSIISATNSPECKNAESPMDCGRKRDAVAGNPPNRMRINNDATIVNQI